MGKIKLKTLQIIGIVNKGAKESNFRSSFGGRIRLMRLMLGRKAVTRAKLKEIKKPNFEAAANWHDREKALLKRIKKLNC